ncbi:hypothetical protein ACS0TY_026546 [Phlomoides rotata]
MATRFFERKFFRRQIKMARDFPRHFTRQKQQTDVEIHPKISYNLVDEDFSRVLTLYQDFKRKDLMKHGDRPYSITYRITYSV